MDVIDRSTLPALHAAARRHRSEYVACLFRQFRIDFLNLFRARPAPRTAACA